MAAPCRFNFKINHSWPWIDKQKSSVYAFQDIQGEKSY